MIAGIVCGLACAACVLVFLNETSAQVDAARAEALERYGGEQVEVVVATRDIASGDTVEAADVALQLWVADLLPEEAYTNIAEVVGRQVTSLVVAGEALCAARFEAAASAAALTVPDGLAAVSVPARDVQAVGGAVEAGMRLDVYATGATSTALIVQDALVLGTSAGGEEGTLGSSSSSWITLAVSPAQVQEVVAAANSADLYFVLPGDDVQAQGLASGADAASAGADSAGAAETAGTASASGAAPTANGEAAAVGETAAAATGAASASTTGGNAANAANASAQTEAKGGV